MFAPKITKPQTKTAASTTTKMVSQQSEFGRRPFGSGTDEQAHLLQRTIGNQARLRLLPPRTLKPPSDQLDDAPAQERDGPVAPGLSRDFSRIPVFPPNPVSRPQPSFPVATTQCPAAIQAKLVVGPVNDPLEREADAAADRVMRMADPKVAVSTVPPQLNRKCQCDDDRQQTAQAKRGEPAFAAGGPVPAATEATLNGPGQPLGAATRAFFEPRFGYNFGQVRVHTDSDAAMANRQLGAQAFTIGAHVFYAAGNGPRSDALTGHELAHVAQQGAAPRLDATGPAQALAQPTAQYSLQRLPGDGIAPPGDCSLEKYLLLSALQGTAVVIAQRFGGCMPTDTCPRLAFIIAAIGAEIAAREAVAVECFRGGDSGHVQQIKDKTAAVDKCLALFLASNCSPDLKQKMEAVVKAEQALLLGMIAVLAIAALVALVIVLVAAIIALVEAIAAAIAAAAAGIAAAAKAAAILAATAALAAMLDALKDELTNA